MANISAAGKYDISHLEGADTQELVSAAKVFYIAGFFLTVSPPSALAVAKHSLENKKVCTFAMRGSCTFGLTGALPDILHEPVRAVHLPVLR